MAHFAQIDENGIVLQVIVVHNSILTNPSGVEIESWGVEYCKKIFGEDTNWVQTSYNASFRARYAGIGFKYVKELDAFIEPQPYPSWTLDTHTTEWVPPTPLPDTDHLYTWDEEHQTWVKLDINTV